MNESVLQKIEAEDEEVDKDDTGWQEKSQLENDIIVMQGYVKYSENKEVCHLGIII